jgi:predicted transglutaminase-like cysteine proteinase
VTVGLVAKVQRDVNAAIEPVPEQPSHDLWTVAPRVGDCEDFALTKREALRAAGLPAGALRLATAYTEAGEYHTVLTVRTERGTVVLDNRFAGVLPLADLPYRWVMVELPDHPLAWAHL